MSARPSVHPPIREPDNDITTLQRFRYEIVMVNSIYERHNNSLTIGAWLSTQPCPAQWTAPAESLAVFICIVFSLCPPDSPHFSPSLPLSLSLSRILDFLSSSLASPSPLPFQF